MPIIVVVLGVIIIALGAAVFLIPAPAETPTETPVTEDATRTESMEMEDETMIEVEAEAGIETSMIDTNATLELETGDTQTFTESGSYLTPARTSHEITVSLTLENGVVAAADVVYDGGTGFSNANQERFDGAFAAEVIGKPLSEISLSRVGGASLTSQAFNEAVAKIVAQS